MKILQIVQSPTGDVSIFVGANRAVLHVRREIVEVLSLPPLSTGDNSTAISFATNITTSEHHQSIFATFDDKSVSKWDVASRQHLDSSVTKKRTNGIVSGHIQGQDVVIMADKVGDLWGFQSQRMKNLGYLGGHPVSIITDIVISDDEKMVVTCDRDEKIKISSFPIIEEVKGYLLGHKNVVTSIALLGEHGEYVVSTGWDHKVILWSTNTYSLLDEHLFKAPSNVEPAALVEPVSDAPSSSSAAATTAGETEEVEERDYNEASAGNYPFKVASKLSNNGSNDGNVAVLFKNEKKIAFLVAKGLSAGDDDSASLQLHSVITTPAQPIDVAFLNSTQVAVVFPHPIYLRVYQISEEVTDVTDSVLSATVLESLGSHLGKIDHNGLALHWLMISF